MRRTTGLDTTAEKEKSEVFQLKRQRCLCWTHGGRGRPAVRGQPGTSHFLPSVFAVPADSGSVVCAYRFSLGYIGIDAEVSRLTLLAGGL